MVNLEFPHEVNVPLDVKKSLQDLFDDKKYGFLRILTDKFPWEELSSYHALLKNYDQVAIIGIGGSSQGSKSIINALEPGLIDQKFVYFDRIDEDYLARQISRVKNKDKTAWFVNSKSGSTTETLFILNSLLEKTEGLLFKNKKNVFVVTENEDSVLGEWAERENLEVIRANGDIEGRFSVFSSYGLMPITFLYQDFALLKKQMTKFSENFQVVEQLSAFYLDSFRQQKWISNIWLYTERLREFGFWLEQIWAEVNIADIDSSFWGAYFQMEGLEITDKEKPEQNLIQVAKIRFELSWDALLRAKFVVNDATIEEIMAYAPRKKAGRIVPVEEKAESGTNKTLQEVESKVLEQSKEQFNENVLGDVASIVGGTDPSEQLKNMQADLKSDARIKELENSLKEKEKVWKERINKLPQKAEIDKLIARSKQLKFDTRNPKQFAEDLKEMDKILKEGDKIVKNFNEASSSLKNDVNSFNTDMKGLDELIKQDINDLQKRLKIPSINVSDFSKGLFGRMINEKLGKYAKYVALAREYMPPKKSETQKSEENQPVAPKSRQVGKSFVFPKKKAYPLFWLKQAKISSKESDSEFSGNISGEIQNATTQPILLGKPMTIDIKGDFPKQGILGLTTNIVVDHTTESPYEKIETTIEQYPLGSQKLSDSNDVKLIIKSATGQMRLSGISRDEKIHFLVKNKFSNVNYEIDSKTELVKDVLINVTSDLPALTVDAEASGPLSQLKWKIKSNLGNELSKGFKKELKAKVDAAKKQLNEFVNNRIKGEKDKLMGQFNNIKGGIDSQINSKKGELDKAKNQAKNEMDNKKKSSDQGVKKEAKKAEKKLKKLLGF